MARTGGVRSEWNAGVWGNVQLTSFRWQEYAQISRNSLGKIRFVCSASPLQSGITNALSWIDIDSDTFVSLNEPRSECRRRITCFALMTCTLPLCQTALWVCVRNKHSITMRRVSFPAHDNRLLEFEHVFAVLVTSIAVSELPITASILDSVSTKAQRHNQFWISLEALMRWSGS